MLFITIDRKSSIRVYRQIIESITRLIDDGTLTAGYRLPSTRSLARQLDLDRSTVYRAYQELQALGYVESTPGSYSTVRERTKLAPQIARGRSAIRWSRISSGHADRTYKTSLRYSPEFEASPGDKRVINLSKLDLDRRLFPIRDLQRCLNHTLSLHGREILGYAPPSGYAPLRECIAQRLRTHGISASGDEVLITNGTQQALELVLRLLGKPGGKVAVESPTYSNMLPLLESYGMKIVGVPMREDGMDLDSLERLFSRDPPDFVYTVPNFQNPTGITTSQDHRERLLSICETFGAPAVEDGFEEDMKYFGKAVLPIKSMDRKRIIIYLGSFSKVLFPGMRLGWIVADHECVARLTALKRFSDISTNHVVQAALDHFCREGYYDKQIRRLHRIFRKRMQHTLNSLEKYMPAGITWTRPMGGYTIWLKMHINTAESFLRREMTRHGILVSPGRYYFPARGSDRYVRISISSLDESEISEGIQRLGSMFRSMMKKRGRT